MSGRDALLGLHIFGAAHFWAAHFWAAHFWGDTLVAPYWGYFCLAVDY